MMYYSNKKKLCTNLSVSLFLIGGEIVQFVFVHHRSHSNFCALFCLSSIRHSNPFAKEKKYCFVYRFIVCDCDDTYETSRSMLAVYVFVCQITKQQMWEKKKLQRIANEAFWWWSFVSVYWNFCTNIKNRLTNNQASIYFVTKTVSTESLSFLVINLFIPSRKM